MRILRGLGGRALPCGCLAGVYETYDGKVVSTIDARGPGCPIPEHRLHRKVTDESEADLTAAASSAGRPISRPH